MKYNSMIKLFFIACAGLFMFAVMVTLIDNCSKQQIVYASSQIDSENQPINEDNTTDLAKDFDTYAQTAVATIVSLIVGSGTGMLIITAFKSHLKKKKEEAAKEAEELRKERLKLKEENDKKETLLKEKMDKVISTDEKTTELKNQMITNFDTLSKDCATKFTEIADQTKTILEILKYISLNDIDLIVNGKASAVAKVVQNETEKREKNESNKS